MNIVCLDMEGVLVPEIWIAFAEESGIPELRRTTRDEPDYDKPVSYTHLDVYKRQGYGRGAILFKYFFYSGSASLLGCAIGFVGGSYIFPKILWHAYNIMYGFGIPIEFVLDGKLAAISVATYLLCALGATYLVCRGFLREVPAELILSLIHI